MATKAEIFEVEQRRQNHAAKGNKSKAAGGQKRRPKAVALPTEDDPASRPQASVRSGRGTYALEASRTARPSRKSTRGSAAHVKTDAPLSLRQALRVSAPAARAARPGRRAP